MSISISMVTLVGAGLSPFEVTVAAVTNKGEDGGEREVKIDRA